MRERFVTADALYGLILCSALIGATSDEDSSALGTAALGLLMIVLNIIVH